MMLASLVQLVEQRTVNPQVPGSSPGGSANFIINNQYTKLNIMGEEVFQGLEQPEKIYYDVNGQPYFRGAVSGDYYGKTFPNVNVVGISPLIGYMIADRFNNQILPVSPFQGHDIIFDMKESGLNKNDFLYVAEDMRQSAVDDSIGARIRRNDQVAANWAKDESDNVGKIGSVGCIGTVTTPYVQMFGPKYQYYSNSKLYDDTKDVLSPYQFVFKDFNYKNLITEMDPDRPGYRMIDRIRVGDIISGLNDDGSGHAQMIVGVERDDKGHVTTVKFRQDAGGLYMPSHMSNSTYRISSYPNPFTLHDRVNIYRIADGEVIDKYVKEHPEEVEHAKKKYPQSKRYGGKLIPRNKYY